MCAFHSTCRGPPEAACVVTIASARLRNTALKHAAGVGQPDAAPVLFHEVDPSLRSSARMLLHRR